jgi:hypothetical protein
VKAASSKPSDEVGWKIGHAVAATGFKECLYSKITLPNHGTFAAMVQVTVRFDGSRLGSAAVSATSKYPADKLRNREDFEPPTEGEVAQELSRVRGCIQGKVAGVSIPANDSKGTVVVHFSGSDLYKVAAL